MPDRSKAPGLIRGLFYSGLVISLLVGLWHFVIPYQFRWWSYIPEAPRSLIVSMDWTNFFFSFLLTGISLILLVFSRRIFLLEIPLAVFYWFLNLTWLFRVLMTLIHPWGYDFMFISQLSLFTLEFLLLLGPSFYLARKIRQNNHA